MFFSHNAIIETHALGRKPIDMTAISKKLREPQATIAGPALDLDLYFRQMSPRTQMLKGYWDAHKVTADKLPRICDIELMDIYEIAPYLSIADVAEKDEDFKNRYWGGELTWRFAFEGTGKPIQDYLPPCFGQKLIEGFRDVVRTEQPQWQKAMLVRGRYNAHFPIEVLHLPLRGKDLAGVQHVLSIFDFVSEPVSR